MTRTQQQHKVRVRKYNRFPGLSGQGIKRQMWWADCSCGGSNGFHDKHEAQAWVCPKKETS